MDPFPLYAQKLFNVPLMIRPEKAEIIVAALAERLGVISLARADGSMGALRDWERSEARSRAEYEVQDGVAVIPVHGTLAQRSYSLQPMSGMTGYNAIAFNLMTALEDDAVRGVLLDIDSPGGEVSGCFDLCDAIFTARGQKPIWASLNESGYSAAYAIASACDHIALPRTGGAGSIGVVCMHVDWSRAIENLGAAITFIQYGAKKVDGAPEKPLSKSALADLQANVDRCGELFVDTVARNRRLKPAAVRAQEAGTFMGDQAVSAGLADVVMPIDQAFAELRDRVASRS
jgi:capsid assembly protease